MLGIYFYRKINDDQKAPLAFLLLYAVELFADALLACQEYLKVTFFVRPSPRKFGFQQFFLFYRIKFSNFYQKWFRLQVLFQKMQNFTL